MANTTLIQYPTGQPLYSIPFDYLSRTFIRMTLINSADPNLNQELVAGRDFRFMNERTVEILVDQTGFDIVRMFRQTSTELIVNFQDGSVLTSRDLTNSELQAIHIAEEGRDQTAEIAKVYSDAALLSATRAKASEDSAAKSASDTAFLFAQGLFGFQLIESFQKGGTLTITNQALKDGTTGEYYRWDGVLPKVVPEGSTPGTTGGIAPGAWVGIGDGSVRASLKGLGAGQGDEMINVKKSFTNSVSRTQRSVNSDYVNVKDFGAVGDGVTDDSPAFQAAINYIRLVDVGGNAHRSRVFGRKLYVPSGTYELKQRLVTSLGYVQNLIIEGDSELTTYLSINNPDGFIDITCTSRVASFELNSVTLLAKYGTASLQPGVGRDDTPASIAEVHDRSSGVAVKMTFPEGISTQRTKSLKMRDVLMTGWNKMRGDYFSEGIYLTGGRNPTLIRVVIEGKYGMFLTGRVDGIFSSGTAFKMIDSYSPTMEDCNAHHYVRGLDLTSRSAEPSYSTSEGGQIIRCTFDAMYGMRVVMPGGEPGFNVSLCHFNFTRAGMEFSGKNQLSLKDTLFYCESTDPSVTCRDIILRGAQKSILTGNIFAKSPAGNRYIYSFYRQAVTNVANTSMVIDNNLYWSGAAGTYRIYAFTGGGSASNVTIGSGECYEGDMSMLFTMGGSDYEAVNPMKLCGGPAPEGVIWAPLGSIYVVRGSGAMYRKEGDRSSSNGWKLMA